MPGRRTGVHFALDMLRHSRCGFFRASVRFSFRCRSPKAGARLVAPFTREGAERRNGAKSYWMLRRASGPALPAGSPYGAPLRCLDGGTPLPRRPAMAIIPWPSDGDATEDSIRCSLVSREAFSTRLPGHGLRDHARGHRTPFTFSSPRERPSANGDTSAILMRPDSVKAKI